MNDTSGDEQRVEGGHPGEAAPEVVEAQRRHLRRILVAFVLVVVLLPIAGLGGALGWLLVPVLVVAALALREAIQLRRSVRLHGPVRMR